MSTLAVEIHDAGILVSGDGYAAAHLPSPSPGYALIDGGRTVTGAAAAAEARLKPKQINTRFWSEVDAANPAVSSSSPHSLTHADLAHAHLSAIWEEVREGGEVGRGGDAEVLLVIPGSYSDAQLGLVLGIARACRMPVTGMVDAALAATMGSLDTGVESPATGFAEKHLLHLDLQLHKTVLTEIMREGDEVVRHRVEVLGQPGLESLRETWVRRIAAAFVRQTRLDPLHAGETEQRLYSALPAFMQELSGGDTAVLQIEAGQKAYAVTLTRAEIGDAVDADYRRVSNLVGTLKSAGEPTALMLSHRASALPGLRERLADIDGIRIAPLSEGVAGAGALRMRAWVRAQGESLPFITRLPAEAAQTTGRTPSAAIPGPTAPAPAVTTSAPAVGPPPPANRAPAVRPPPPTDRPTVVADKGSVRAGSDPTHVLYQGRAYAITEEPFVLGIAVPVGRRGISLRGQTAGISRAHCSIRREGDRVIAEDHSTHGTLLNQERLDGQEELQPGDRLRLGNPGIELILILVVDEGGVDGERGLS